MPDVVLADATAAMSHADATFIAAVHGFAIGAAVELCCACDLRIAAEGATFRVPAARLGVVYHAAGIGRLRAAFGPAGVSRLLLLGDPISAREADAMGALVRCVASDDLDATVDEIVARLGGIDRESFAANRDFLRALARDPGDHEARVAHEAARARAYARLGAGRRG